MRARERESERAREPETERGREADRERALDESDRGIEEQRESERE